MKKIISVVICLFALFALTLLIAYSTRAEAPSAGTTSGIVSRGDNTRSLSPLGVSPTPSPTPTSDCPAAWVVIPNETYAPYSAEMQNVGAVSSSDAWAVGDYLEHWDGSHWTGTLDDPPGFAEALYGIDVISADDIWMVGWYEGSFSGSLTEHWDGTQWHWVQSPNGSGGGTWTQLNAVSAASTDDVWAVGTTDRYQGGNALILHWDGTAWAVQGQGGSSAPNLKGVAAIASDDVWTVGTLTTGLPMIEHWNGTAWSESPLPTLTGTSGLYAVKGISANDVWAVGNDGDQTLTLHWDGATWSIVPSPNLGILDRLFAVDALASDDMWAVGKYNIADVQKSLTMHWNGSAWTIVSSPSPNAEAVFQGVSMLSSGEAWAVGYTSTFTQSTPLTVLYSTTGVCPTATPTATSTSTRTATRTPSVTVTAIVTVTVTVIATSTSIPATNTATSTPETQTVTTTATATLIATPTPCIISFTDVQPTDYFYEPVRYLYCEGVISGYPNGTFQPYNNASRGQLSKIVVLAEGMPINTAGGPHFTDVPQVNPFYPYIETAYNAGLISGYADGTFRWSDNVTRGQICKIVVNAEGWSIDTGGGPHFPDVLPGSTFYAFIETAYHHGIISGYPDGEFGPNNPATRGQISKIVYNAVTAP